MKLINVFFLSLMSLNTFSQLKVRTNGTVKIGSASPLPSGGRLEITGLNETLESRLFVLLIYQGFGVLIQFMHMVLV